MGKSRDSRFLDRVLCCHERASLTGACVDDDRRLWTFWSAKEAAYKVAVKRDDTVPSAPLRYEVHLKGRTGNAQKGVVHTPFGSVAVTIEATPSYIHCVAGDGEAVIGTAGAVDMITDTDPSTAVRDLLIRRCATVFRIKSDRCRIVREKGSRGLLPPALLIDGYRAPWDISLSHDGRFIACAFSLLQ